MVDELIGFYYYSQCFQGRRLKSVWSKYGPLERVDPEQNETFVWFLEKNYERRKARDWIPWAILDGI